MWKQVCNEASLWDEERGSMLFQQDLADIEGPNLEIKLAEEERHT